MGKPPALPGDCCISYGIFLNANFDTYTDLESCILYPSRMGKFEITNLQKW